MRKYWGKVGLKLELKKEKNTLGKSAQRKAQGLNFIVICLKRKVEQKLFFIIIVSFKAITVSYLIQGGNYLFCLILTEV